MQIKDKIIFIIIFILCLNASTAKLYADEFDIYALEISFDNEKNTSNTQFNFINLMRECSSVTGACLLTKREIFDQSDDKRRQEVLIC